MSQGPCLSLLAPGPPEVIAVEVTNVCNLTCTMCPRSLAGVNLGEPRAFLPARVWAEVVRIAPRIGTITLNGLSENLLHPRFLDLVEEIEESGARVVFSTNGTLIDPEVAARIGRLRRLHAINVSIDSADTEEYRRIRGGPLGRARAGIQNLVAATNGPAHIAASAWPRTCAGSRTRSSRSFPYDAGSRVGPFAGRHTRCGP